MGCNTSKHVEENNVEQLEEEDEELLQMAEQEKLLCSDRPNDRYPPFMNGVAWEPEKVDKEGGQEIDYQLALDWIYGASKKNTKGNLCAVNREGHIVYTAAAVGVIYDPVAHTQKHVLGHTDDIICIDMHPEGELVATGSRGKDDTVQVWNSITGKVEQVLETNFTPGGVNCVSFCRSNPNLIAVIGGNKENQSIQIYNWVDNEKIFEEDKITSRLTYSFLFRTEKEMVWTGKRDGVLFLTLNDGKLDIEKAKLGEDGKRQSSFCSCLGANETQTIVGVKSGDIYVFDGPQLKTVIKAHDGTCRAVYRCKGGFVSVGKDGVCRSWQFDDEAGAKQMKSVEMNDYARGVCVCDSLAYVFEKDGDIYRVSFEDETKELLQYGHASRGELWGVAAVGNKLYTASDDKRLVVVDTITNKKINEVKGSENPRDIDVSPNGQYIAVATEKGNVYVLSAKDVEAGTATVHKKLDVSKANDERCECVRFSPNGQYLAIGSADTTIYVFDVLNNFKRVGRMRDHSSTVFNLSWSSDSKYLVTVCRAYELLFWGVSSKGRWRRIPYPTTMTDIDWHEYSCTLGWKVRGVWDMSDYNDGSDINQLAVSSSRSLIAVGDDHGKIQLVRYPTLYQLPKREAYSGHSSHITRVKFCGDFLYSGGGFDECVFKWRVVKKSDS